MADIDLEDHDHVSFRFLKPCFTAKDFADKFEKILSDDSFRVNVSKLRVSAKAQGGRERAV
jgi:hypothetical protein